MKQHPEKQENTHSVCRCVGFSLMVKHLDGRGLSLTRSNLATLEPPQHHTQAAQLHLLHNDAADEHYLTSDSFPFHPPLT